MEQTTNKNEEYMAIGALVLGIINLCAWFVPLCGFPLAIVGIVLGYMGRNSAQRTLAIIGIVLSSIALVLTIGNAAIGAYLGATGQLFQ
ncbi:MAG: hypothetical protein KJ069_01020 [Anaerolineae bacterium]|nr:hypothetical protein [Anaerolineae bacterium]